MRPPDDLIGDAIAESSRLELKRELPGRSDKDRFEFLKDVCAFANSGGGVIYYGVGEKNGIAGYLVPITSDSYDNVTRRLGQILDAGIEPRLRSVRFCDFKVNGGYIVGLEVAPSFNMPHRLVHNGHSKFVMRNHTHVSEMTFDQLRQAFNRAGRLTGLAKQEWERTVAQISARGTWRNLPAGPICVVELTPFTSVEGVTIVNVQDAYSDFGSFIFDDWGGASHTFNLDGAVFYRGGAAETVYAYTEVHRTGKVRAIKSGAAYREEKLIPSQRVAEFFREAVNKFARYVQKYEIPAPYLVNSALLGVEGYRLALDSRHFFFEDLLPDRQNLILPTMYFEGEFSGAAEQSARSLLDVLWQGFGTARCTYYNDEGVWSAR